MAALGDAELVSVELEKNIGALLACLIRRGAFGRNEGGFGAKALLSFEGVESLFSAVEVDVKAEAR